MQSPARGISSVNPAPLGMQHPKISSRECLAHPPEAPGANNLQQIPQLVFWGPLPANSNYLELIISSSFLYNANFLPLYFVKQNVPCRQTGEFFSLNLEKALEPSLWKDLKQKKRNIFWESKH